VSSHAPDNAAADAAKCLLNPFVCRLRKGAAKKETQIVFVLEHLGCYRGSGPTTAQPTPPQKYTFGTFASPHPTYKFETQFVQYPQLRGP
jgi:hypothetical protein